MSVRTPSTAPSGAPGGSPDERPYPWRLFVGMLLAILVGGAILAVMLGLNPLTFQRFAPATQPTSVATALPVSAPATTVTRATATGSTAAAAAPMQTQASTPATGVAPSAAQTPLPLATTVAAPAVATAVPATQVVIAPTTAPTPEPTRAATTAEATPIQAAVSPELAAAIIQGYDNYWSVRVRAIGDPADTSIGLESVMAGQELSAAYETLAEYRDAGEAYQATVHHQIWLTQATSNAAEIVDRFTATTIKLDPQTKQPVETTPQVEHITGRFLLQSVDGVWKVVGRRQED